MNANTPSYMKQYLPEALLSLLAAPCFVFFADVFGDEVTLD